MSNFIWQTAVGVAAWIGLAWSGLAWSPTVLAAEQRVPLRVAIHVHSTASTGTLSLEDLAVRAEQQGLDAIVLSDNFSLEYEYGLQPLPGLLKKTVSFPSILSYGVERYLDEIHTVQARHPRLVIVPGVEVAPFYYWTGSLWRGDLTMHDAQRNLLVLGLTKAEDYRALPARGNPASFTVDGASLANAAPLLLVIPALFLWKPRRQSVKGWREPVSAARRTAAACCLVLAVATLVHAWPLGTPPFSSYDSQLGYRPYQALVDVATQRGAIVFWSMTEARDLQAHAFGPLGTVTVRTDAHPEALALTNGYAGFGGLYQDTRMATAAGGLWDQVIQAHKGTAQSAVPTMIGEIAFHGLADKGKDLDRVVTTVFAQERSVAGVLEAIRSGHAYAVAEGDHRVMLTVDEFSLGCDCDPATVGIGDHLALPSGSHVVAMVRLSARDGKSHPVTMRLIRSGEIIGIAKAETPVQYQLADMQPVPDGGAYYRLEVVGQSGELLTNPLYVDVQTKERG
ncbi:hypothetical protein [Nitrospira lenta]|uniref:Polymerase/histidinol phosphatase N-terminal domain-containing protein n=1 Tax=Nitrospira lenta TaxID=1436998 RepID=A0A330LC32_9BACT|nr:hypothetical protein [Nitrospira lenta]SPP66499.1 membrane hypothetical protein [Nitrospira lenta]